MDEESKDDAEESTATDGDGTPPVETAAVDDTGWGATEAEADDREWDDPPGVEGDEAATDDQSAVGGNVFGSAVSDAETLQPGRPNPENVAFVLLGVVLSAFVFYQFFLLAG